MAGPELEATIGEDASFLVALYDSDGLAVAGLTGSEPLAGSVWTGEDEAASFAPACTWYDAANAVAKVAVAGSQTSALSAGLYALLVRITTGSGTSDAIRGTLRLRPSPGTATPRPVYSTFQRMLNRAAWLGRLQQTDAGLTGFAEQRADAREWLDDLILRHFRSGNLGASAYPCTAQWGAGFQRTGQTNPYLKGLLAANKLIVTPKVEEAVTLYAIGLAARAQVGQDPKSEYPALARQFLAWARSKALCLTAEIDSNGDGVGEMTIELGTADTLYG